MKFSFKFSCSLPPNAVSVVPKEELEEVQQGTNIHERLLNKPYVNEVHLTGQNLT